MVGRISFFVNAGIRFVTEMCKMRALAELWDELQATRCGVTDAKYRRFRDDVHVNALGLTEQRPENNGLRILLEMLAATLSQNARARPSQLPASNKGLGRRMGRCGARGLWPVPQPDRGQRRAIEPDRRAECVAQAPRCDHRQVGAAAEFVMAKPGLNGHSNGAGQIAARARDCGMAFHCDANRRNPRRYRQHRNRAKRPCSGIVDPIGPPFAPDREGDGT